MVERRPLSEVPRCEWQLHVPFGETGAGREYCVLLLLDECATPPRGGFGLRIHCCRTRHQKEDGREADGVHRTQIHSSEDGRGPSSQLAMKQGMRCSVPTSSAALRSELIMGQRNSCKKASVCPESWRSER